MKLLAERSVSIPSDRVIAVLLDPEFVASNTPYLVGVRGEKLVLMFRRLVIGFSDEYSLLVEGSVSEKRAAHLYQGSKSTIKIEYRGMNGVVRAFGEYRGPRAWIVSRKLRGIAESLLNDAEKAARERRIGGGLEDFSGKLSSLSWVSKLVMKSILVKNEITIIPRGGLPSYIEGLITEKILQRYPVVYVSGSAENGSFRLLFVDGEPRGVYAVVEGREYIGDDSVLNRLEGATRVKVYALLAKQVEVLAK